MLFGPVEGGLLTPVLPWPPWMWYFWTPSLPLGWCSELCCSEQCCLTLPMTFCCLFWSFLTLFLERALSFIPPQQSSSLSCLSTPKASGVKNSIWKAWSLKSRAVNHTPGLASTDRWEREEAGPCPGGQEWVQERGQVAQVLIWVWRWTSQHITSLCASGFLLLNALIPALALSWGNCKDSSDAWYQSERNHREEIPLSVIQEGVVVLVSLIGPRGWRMCAKLMIFHTQAGAPCLLLLRLFTEG